MGGGLMQLVAYGSQDIYLTGQPQITFFKSVYRRHTNFAIESIQQTINGSTSFGSRVSVTVSRNGDLLKRLWVEYSPLNLLSSVSTNDIAANVGHNLLDQLELEIGGQLIDRQYGKWLTIWNYLTESNPTGQQGSISTNAAEPGSTDTASVESIERPTRYNRMAYTHRAEVAAADATSAPYRAWVPMQFWFCKNPGLAIPLIALQYHEVKFNITLGAYNGISDSTAPTSATAFNGFSVYADYIYLDTTERRQFAQNAHEYLIDQLQIQSDVTANLSVRLNFNHPVKELIWAIPPIVPVSGGNLGGSSSPGGGFTPSTTVAPNNYKIVLNGTDRFTERDITYFTRNQVWDSHTGFGSVLFPDCIAVYSFALRPEEHQPSGTCNFSRIDTAQLIRTVGNNIDIYAVNYNVLRIMSGMGGLAYSN